MASRIAIVGAGFGGLCMAIQLERAGITSYALFEKATGLGGTWRDNTYPGAGCDIPAYLYSYSFEKYAGWSRRYPNQQKILRYLSHCADKYGVRRKIRFESEVTSATFKGKKWRMTVRTASGATVIEEFDVVVSAVGQLNRPHVPHIPGISLFGGTVFHSARWDHGHDLTGRRVAVIGTGSSAAQFIPDIAETAAHLSVFQRTPNWVLPKADAEFPAALQQAFRRLPWLRHAYRAWIYRYAEGAVHPALAGGWSARLLRERALRHLRRQVGDPELRARLTPDYPPGCKRVVIDSHFYPALTRPNVDVISEGIARITPTGIETADGRLHEVDTIVYATGFRSTEFLAPMEITGRDGLSLRKRWHEGAEAYLGIAVPGFPNLFLLYGPNTNLGHNSIVFMLECQVNHVLRCLPYLAGGEPMEVRPEVMAAWRAQLDLAMARMVWNGGCQSWYKTASGRVTNNWPGTTPLYRRLTARSPERAYRVG